MVTHKLNELAKIPTTAGIYLFFQKKTPVYIGKSVNLKARIKSHLENAKIDQKEAAITEAADRIAYIVTDSEFKALILESKYIQKFQPKYNVRWRDDKSYLYIKATVKDEFPKFFITRKEKMPGCLYFGPFPSMAIARDILKEIRRVFPFCTQKNLGNSKCFYAKIGLCAPCPNEIVRIQSPAQRKLAKAEYLKNTRNALKVLSGNTELVLKHLYKKVHEFKILNKFEQAIPFRDRILRLENVVLKKHFDPENLTEYNQSEKRIAALLALLGKYLKIVKLERIECYDVSTLAFENSTASMVVFTDGLSDKKEYRRFKIKNKNASSDFEMLKEILERRFKNNWPNPDLIVVDGGKPQVRIARQVVGELNMSIPLVGIAKRPDRLILGESLLTIRPDRHHQGLRLLQDLRDESHRFAKKYHLFLRAKRERGIIKSKL